MNRFNSHLRWMVVMTLMVITSTTAFSTESNYNDLSAAAWGLYCPADVTISCTTNTSDLSSYGWAYVHDYSGYTYLYDPEVNYNLTSCNTGTITRTWSAYNPYGNYWHSCTQTIHVQGGYGGSFGLDNIHWPSTPYTLEGCDPDVDPYNFPSEYGPPTFDYVACSQIGISYNDVLFTVNSTCKKIIRKWKVIDWCQYDVSTGAGLWSFDQTIKIMDNVAPDYTCPSDVTVTSTNCKNAMVNVEHVTVDPASCGGYFSVRNYSPYALDDGADISGVYPVGTTKVQVIISYGCGYRKSCWIEVTVNDDKPPTPYCLHTITTALMPVDSDGDGLVDDGMVEIWAEDLDKGSIASCNNGPLTFSFSEDVSDKSRMFTCANAGSNEVQVWVTDRHGNQDWCVSYIVVQNNGANIPDCEPFNYVSPSNREHNISGQLTDIYNNSVGSASMELVDMDTWIPHFVYDTSYIIHTDTIFHADGTMAIVDNAEMHVETTQVRPIEHPYVTMETTDMGVFYLEDALATNHSYMIRSVGQAIPSGQINYDDAYILIRHILGQELFKNPYQYIAADVNMDQQVNMKDFTLLFNYIKYGTSLNDSRSWVIIDGAYEWTLPSEALKDCPEEVYLDAINASVTGVPFKAIQLGDLTNNSNSNVKTKLSALMLSADTDHHRADVSSNSLNLRSMISDLDVPVVTLFPNPFTSELTVRLESLSEDSKVTVRLLTIDGQEVYNDVLSVGKGVQQISIQPEITYTGMLIYEINSGQGIFTGKVIRQ